jgi:DNA-binding MarR family transcriptional regulator
MGNESVTTRTAHTRTAHTPTDQTRVDQLRADVFSELMSLAPLLEQLRSEGLRRRGLTPARARLLRVLDDDGPLLMSELSRALDVTPRAVTGLVDGLEADGFARRAEHPSDRRATLVELTPAGRRFCREMRNGVARVTRDLLGDAPAHDLATALALLEAVHQQLDARRVSSPPLHSRAVAPR